MALTINQLAGICAEYNTYKSSLSDAQRALNNIITQGTPFYLDPNMAAQFPTDWPTYQQYLLSVQTAINNFINTFPAEPPLGK